MIEKLQKLGLSNKEAQIYLALAEKGESTANELAKQSSTQRTVVYNILQQLMDKGLVSYINKDKKRYFSVKPESLLSSVRERETIAKDLIEEIGKLKTSSSHSSKVEVYEGLEGMKSIFDEIRKSKELFVINATGKIFENLIYSAHHILKDITFNSHPKVIAVQSMKNTELARYKPMEVKYLPKEAENKATTFIFEGKVIIQVLKDKPFLIRIENRDIYEGYKKDFDVLWAKL
jgi:sugar-specific transcriptional regulator TrmB